VVGCGGPAVRASITVKEKKVVAISSRQIDESISIADFFPPN
jgi:hypothetical protein